MGKHSDLSEFAKRQRDKSPAAEEEQGKAAAEPTKRLNANVPESLHQAVRMEAARRGVDMKDILMEALAEYLPEYSDE